MTMNQVHPGAKIGKNVEIGPFTTIYEHVEIGDNVWIGPGVTIFDYVKIGDGCKVFPGAVLGAVPQDLKFNGEITYVEIGSNTTIREYATVNRGTAASGRYLTKVGDNCLVMSYVHIAHDCSIGNHCILSSFAGMAGETDIEDWVVVGGGALIHQFSKVGAHAMLGGGTGLTKDVPPFLLVGRNPVVYEGINIVGLRRRGFSNEDINEIHAIYNTIYNSGLNISEACIKAREDFAGSKYVEQITGFIAASKRGVVK